MAPVCVKQREGGGEGVRERKGEREKKNICLRGRQGEEGGKLGTLVARNAHK